MADIVDNKKEWDFLKQRLSKAQSLEVAVGFFEGKTGKRGNQVVEYAAFNEYGTSKAPSRPFMAITFENSTQIMDKAIESEVEKVLLGRKSADIALSGIGDKYKKELQKSIQLTNFLPRLSRSTVQKKKSEKTLIDTGKMLESIEYKVRRAK